MTGELAGMLAMAAVPVYLILQPLALARWKDGWRRAAALPLALTIPAGAFSLFALAQDSNLWPIALIFACFIGAPYLIALGLVRLLL